MRFGLVGTGQWATRTHGPGLTAATGVELVGVWGRHPDRTAAIADDLGEAADDDDDELLESVEVVAFAVPPRARVRWARKAPATGTHLLLNKPVADSLDDARALVEE